MLPQPTAWVIRVMHTRAPHTLVVNHYLVGLRSHGRKQRSHYRVGAGGGGKFHGRYHIYYALNLVAVALANRPYRRHGPNALKANLRLRDQREEVRAPDVDELERSLDSDAKQPVPLEGESSRGQSAYYEIHYRSYLSIRPWQVGLVPGKPFAIGFFQNPVYELPEPLLHGL